EVAPPSLVVLLFPHADSTSAPVASTPTAAPNRLNLKSVPLNGRTDSYLNCATRQDGPQHSPDIRKRGCSWPTPGGFEVNKPSQQAERSAAVVGPCAAINQSLDLTDGAPINSLAWSMNCSA